MKIRRITFYLYVLLLVIIFIFFINLNNNEIAEKYIYTIQDLLNNKLYIWLIALVLISVINFLYTRRLIFIKVNEKYFRDCNNIISPIFADYVIDEKSDIRNLILSCIVDLVDRKKLENIGNKKIRLVSTEGLTDVEKDIINYIFVSSNEIEFKEIDEMLSNNSGSTANWFTKIKKDIISYLYKIGIYDIEKKKFIKSLNLFQKFVYFQILFVTFIYSIGDIKDLKMDNVFYAIVLFCIISVVLVIMYKSNISKSIDKDLEGIIQVENMNNPYVLSIKIFLTFIVMIMVSMTIVLTNNSLWLAIPMLFGIAINELYMNFGKYNVLTNNGKEEYKKIYGLRNYIKDYSIMKKNEVDSVEIWNLYLTYAIAFGQANKVLKKMDKYGLQTDILIDSLKL